MDYYVIPEFVYIFFLFCAAVVIVSAIYVVVDQIRLHIRKKQKEKEFFADRVEYSPEELAKMKERFPGKYEASVLCAISDECKVFLNAFQAIFAEEMDNMYNVLGRELAEEQERRVFEEIQHVQGLLGFFTFMQDHGINAYLTYLQNGEIFFEDKPERVEDGEVK